MAFSPPQPKLNHEANGFAGQILAASAALSLLSKITDDHHLNQSLPVNTPLFTFKTADDSWAPKKRNWFMDCCNNAWTTSLIPRLTRHSFHIGNTTHLLLLGVDPFIVMVQGHWKSDAFLSYWKNCKQILPLFIGSALCAPDSIISSMNLFT